MVSSVSGNTFDENDFDNYTIGTQEEKYNKLEKKLDAVSDKMEEICGKDNSASAMLLLLDEYINLVSEKLELFPQLDSISEEELSLDKINYTIVIPSLKVYYQIMSNQPNEAIANCTKCIEMLNSPELVNLLTSIFGSNFSKEDLQIYEPTLRYLRSFAYLMVGQVDLGIADLQAFLKSQPEENSFYSHFALHMRILEQHLGVPFLEKKELSELEFQQLNLEEKIEFCLENGEGEKVLQLIEDFDDKTNPLFMEHKAIALELIGDHATASKLAAQCLEEENLDLDVLEHPDILFLLTGNFSKAREESNSHHYLPMLTNGNSGFPEWHPLIQYIESTQKKPDLSLVNCKV